MTTNDSTIHERIRVGLVDDHHVVRDGLGLVIAGTTDIVVVGEAASAEDAFELLDREHPDVLVLDLTLGDADGIPLLRCLLARQPGLRVVILTMHEDAETVRQSLLAGAHGYVVKGARTPELFDAIRAVMRDERYIHSHVVGAIIDDSIQWQRSGGGLTPREREILTLLAGGQSPGQIGHSIGISVFTVRRHISNLASKLDVHGVSALRQYAQAHGLQRE